MVCTFDFEAIQRESALLNDFSGLDVKDIDLQSVEAAEAQRRATLEASGVDFNNASSLNGGGEASLEDIQAHLKFAQKDARKAKKLLKQVQAGLEDVKNERKETRESWISAANNTASISSVSMTTSLLGGDGRGLFDKTAEELDLLQDEEEEDLLMDNSSKIQSVRRESRVKEEQSAWEQMMGGKTEGRDEVESPKKKNKKKLKKSKSTDGMESVSPEGKKKKLKKSKSTDGMESLSLSVRKKSLKKSKSRDDMDDLPGLVEPEGKRKKKKKKDKDLEAEAEEPTAEEGKKKKKKKTKDVEEPEEEPTVEEEGKKKKKKKKTKEVAEEEPQLEEEPVEGEDGKKKKKKKKKSKQVEEE